MNKNLIISAFLFCALQTLAYAGWGDAISKAAASVTTSSKPLSDTKIGQGLKEALLVGTEKTVALTGKQDGYLKNEAIKILMPERLKTANAFLRKVGLSAQMDELVLSMNRAAEAAAPQAKSIFVNAITNMSLEDVQKIYKGGDTAATQYFQAKTTPELILLYRPVVMKTMAEYQVSKIYQGITGKYNALPTAKLLPAPEIENYVVEQALGGLFKILGEQEKAIRENPAARTTQILKDVFSRKKSEANV